MIWEELSPGCAETQKEERGIEKAIRAWPGHIAEHGLGSTLSIKSQMFSFAVGKFKEFREESEKKKNPNTDNGKDK